MTVWRLVLVILTKRIKLRPSLLLQLRVGLLSPVDDDRSDDDGEGAGDDANEDAGIHVLEPPFSKNRTHYETCGVFVERIVLLAGACRSRLLTF